MADSVKHVDFGLMDVLFLGDLKISFGRNSRRHWLRVESLSGGSLPEFASTATGSPSHKFVDVVKLAAYIEGG